MKRNKIVGWVLLVLFNVALAFALPLGYATFYLIVNEGKVTLAYLTILICFIYTTVSTIILDILVKRKGINYLVSIFMRRRE